MAAPLTHRRRAARQEKLQQAVGIREDIAEQRLEARERARVAQVAATGRAGVHAEQRLAAALVWEATLDALRAAGVARDRIDRAGAVFSASNPNLKADANGVVRNRAGEPLTALVAAWTASPAAQPWLSKEPA